MTPEDRKVKSLELAIKILETGQNKDLERDGVWLVIQAQKIEEYLKEDIHD